MDPVSTYSAFDNLQISSLSSAMEHDERILLAEALVCEGEFKLLRGDRVGIEFFQKAAELSPNDPALFYRQGLALCEYGSEEGREKALLIANKKFKAAVGLNPSFFEAWQSWGNSLSHLGTTYEEHHYFLEAEEKFRRALDLCETKPSDLLAELFWGYGVVKMHIAMRSGEAVDFHEALDVFQKATTYEEKFPAEFWIDFGKTTLELASQINDLRLHVKAINCFKQAISCRHSFEGWQQLAIALEKLYHYTHDEDHFSQANECYQTASGLCPNNTEIWMRWAQLLMDSGRRNQDLKRIRSCIEKCHRAYACDPNDPTILALWAEGLALLGDLSERLDLLNEAENKISQALDMESDTPELWYSFGMFLSSLAHYFQDSDYYYQAIEKFQYGLSLDRTYHKLWHALANTYLTVGLMDVDRESFERACKFFAKACDLNPSNLYFFDYGVALSKLGELTHSRKRFEEALFYFEKALSTQKNALYLHPEWLFHYAATLDMLGDFHTEDSYYTRAIEILSHVLMVDPDFPQVHYRLALAFSHLGECSDQREYFYRSLHHFRLAAKHEEENDQTLLDWGVTLINVADYTSDLMEKEQLFLGAEQKLIQAAKLGNQTAYYQLACLYSLCGDYDKSMHFLEKAHLSASLPHVEELLDDEWLDGVRGTSQFRGFLAQLEKKNAER